MLRNMAEVHVSASELRIHFKDLANDVARGGDPVIVYRHGYEMVVMVSLSDYRKIQSRKKAEPDAPRGHPDSMSTEDLEHWCAVTKGSTDPDTMMWRMKAERSLALRKAWPAAPPKPPS